MPWSAPFTLPPGPLSVEFQAGPRDACHYFIMTRLETQPRCP